MADINEKIIKKLTPEEQTAVMNLVKAVEALPDSICLDLASWKDEEYHLAIQWREDEDSGAHAVARIHKPTLLF